MGHDGEAYTESFTGVDLQGHPCVALNDDFDLEDRPCDEENPFICEFDCARGELIRPDFRSSLGQHNY